MLPVSGEAKRCADVVGFEIRKVGEDLLFGHPGCEVIQNVGDGEAQIANRRLAKHPFGVNRYSWMVWHLHRRRRSRPEHFELSHTQSMAGLRIRDRLA